MYVCVYKYVYMYVNLCINMYVCIYVYEVSEVSLLLNAYMLEASKLVHAYLVYWCVHICSFKYVAYLLTWTRVHVPRSPHMHIHTFICTYIHTYIHSYILAYKGTCAHKHTCTHNRITDDILLADECDATSPTHNCANQAQ